MAERIDIKTKDWWEMFNKPKMNNFRSLGYRKKDRAISYATWRKIIMTYFHIYFYELFFIGKANYFFLGGLMKLCKIKASTKKRKDGTTDFINPTVGIFWYNMPCERFMYAIKICKMMGSTNRFPKLQRLWSETNDVHMLEESHIMKKRHLINNNYYRK